MNEIDELLIVFSRFIDRCVDLNYLGDDHAAFADLERCVFEDVQHVVSRMQRVLVLILLYHFPCNRLLNRTERDAWTVILHHKDALA